MTHIEREEEAIEKALERGEITNAQAVKEINELWRDYRAAAQESAREAADRELERW